MINNKLANTMRVRFMRASPRLYTHAAEWYAKTCMFKDEKAALQGNFANSVDEPSVLHFVYNRCGSRYVSGVILNLLSGVPYQHLDYERYCGHCRRGNRDFLQQDRFIDDGLSARGHVYGPFYHFHDCFLAEGALERFKIVLNLRDPRDVLTSRFYSQAYAHTLFHPKHVERRKQVQEMGIDAFVLEQCAEIKLRYETYFDKLVGRDNVLFLPYERMVSDFTDWLRELAAFLDVDPEGREAKQVRDEADFSVNKEDKFAHRRSVKPGNHLKKLKPETIQFIEEELQDLIPHFSDRFSFPAHG